MPQAIPLAVGSFLFNAGASLAVVNFFAIGFGATLITGGLTVGLGILAQSVLTPTAPAVKPSDGQTVVNDPMARRLKSYGTVRVAGARQFAKLDPGTRRLYMLFAINHGRISRFINYFLDDNEVEVDGSEQITTSPYTTTNNYIRVRLGEFPETAYSELEAVFGVSEVRGDGVASILVDLKNDSDPAVTANMFPQGKPLVRTTIDSSVVWDPRDVTQSRTDDGTWLFSENPIACLLDYALDPDGYGIPWELIEPVLDEWIAAMDVCDESVPLKAGGVSPRYRLAVTFALTDDPVDVSNRILQSCDGKFWPRRDGTISVRAGRYVEPTVHIQSRDIVGYQQLTRGQDLLSAVAGVRAQFMSPDHDYREHETEPWPNADYVIGLEEGRVATLDHSMVPSGPQSRRLQKRFSTRANAEWRGTIMTTAAGLAAMDESTILLTVDEGGDAPMIDALKCEIGAFTLDPNPPFNCTIEVLSVDETIDEWDPAAEEGEAEPGEFAVLSITSKVGTTFDPILEGFGVNGQTVIILPASTAAMAATPSGYGQIQKILGDGVGIGGYWKTLDGTEGASTFLSVAGPIFCILTENAGSAPTFSHKVIDTDPSGGGSASLIENEEESTPQLVIAHGASLAVLTDLWSKFFDPSAPGEVDPDYSAILGNGATITANVELIHYTSSEDPIALRSYDNRSPPPGYASGEQVFVMRPSS